MRTREQVEAMSDEERRIKTAELHLKKNVTFEVTNFYEVFPYVDNFCPQPFDRLGEYGWLKRIELLDYLDSLDAMALAVSALDRFQVALFEVVLCEIVSDGEFDRTAIGVSEMHYVDALNCMHATARQRNTAFLMVMLP